MPADHPLAVAASHCHPQTDVVLAADGLGRAIDVRILALTALVEPTDAARTEIKAAFRELNRIAGHEESGACGPYWAWYRRAVTLIRREAVRLFSGEDWVIDVRGPAWRSGRA